MVTKEVTWDSNLLVYSCTRGYYQAYLLIVETLSDMLEGEEATGRSNYARHIKG